MWKLAVVIVIVAFGGAIVVFGGMVGALSALAQLLFATFIVLAFASALIILPDQKSPILN